MPKNPNKPRVRRLLLQAVGVGTSVAMFGCGSTHTLGVATADLDGGRDGSPAEDAMHPLLGTFIEPDAGIYGQRAEDAGPVGDSVDAAGSLAVDAGPQGTSIDDAGIQGTVIDAAGVGSH
jgi:hypothetical protein